MQQSKYSFLQEIMGCIPIFLIMVYNIITLGSTINALIVIPQALIVLYFIFKGRTDKALLYHLIFYISCISSETAGIEQLYSYSRLKIVGPINVSDFLILLILMFSIGKKKKKKYVLFGKLNEMYKYLFATAFAIGLFGVMLLDYDVKKFFIRSLYLAFTLIHAYSILLNDTEYFRKKVVDNVYRLLWCGIVSTAFCYFILGITVEHSGVEDLFVGPDIKYMAAMLLFGFFEKNTLWISIGLLSYLSTFLIGMSGKGLIIFFFAIIAFLYILYTKRHLMGLSMKFLFATFIILVVFLGVRAYLNTDLNAYVLSKQASFTSLFTGYENMDSSPKIRVASTINIFYIGLYNPLFLLFGHGYGGYFTDELNLFSVLNLGDAAWPADEVHSGKFTSAHDTFASVPLFNGLIGLIWVIWLTYKYMKVFRYSYMSFMAVIYLFLTFYYNFHLAAIGVLFLYAAEVALPLSKINKKKYEKNTVYNKS